VSYALNATGYTPLTLQNNWAAYSSGRAPAVASSGGIVRFQGAVSSGASGQVMFTLPSAMVPPVNTYVTVDMVNAAKGRIYITTAGAVYAYAPNAADATAFTSLDGAWFALGSNGYSSLPLASGWTTYGSSRGPAGIVSGNIVRLQGAISGGTSTAPFVLPSGLKPSAEVWVPVGLLNAAHGRLHILPNGTVTLQAENAFSDATSFTNLEGVFFGL
jgi:hypothetical protein